jgi:hypothetical protein
MCSVSEGIRAAVSKETRALFPRERAAPFPKENYGEEGDTGIRMDSLGAIEETVFTGKGGEVFR